MIEVKNMFKLNKKDSSLKAYVAVVLDEKLLLKGIKVVEGKDGLFVAMPQQQGKDGKWYETVTFLTSEAKEALQEAVLKAYEAKKS